MATLTLAQRQHRTGILGRILTHSSQCSNSNCPIPKCNKIRKVHDHLDKCDKETCVDCVRFAPLVLFPAHYCQGKCKLHYCRFVKTAREEARKKGLIPTFGNHMSVALIKFLYVHLKKK